MVSSLGTRTMVWDELDILLLEETYETGQSFTYTYDAKGNRTSKSQDGTAFSEAWTYDLTWNKPLSYTDPNGNTTNWQLYESNGAIEKKTDAESGVTEFTYDNFGNLTQTKDPNGNIVGITYDDFGYPKLKTLPDGHTNNYTFDTRGRLLEEAENTGRVTLTSYDALDNVVSKNISAASSGGVQRTFGEFLPMGQPGFITNGDLYRTFVYDDLNRVVTETIDPGHGQPILLVTNVYDIHSNKIQETHGDNSGLSRVWDRNFDAADRLLNVTLDGEPDGEFLYQAGTSLVTSETDWTGAVTRHEYDTFLRPIRTILPTNHVERMEYDLAGNMTRATDANDNATTSTYDKVNRPIKTTNALSQKTVMTYDANGNLIKEHNTTNGEGTELTYDGMNRVISQTVLNLSGSGDQITTTTYEGFGRLRTTTLSLDAPIIKRFNQMGQLISREQNGITTGFTYDANGTQIRIDHPESYVTVITNDALGRRLFQKSPHDYEETFAYNVFGELISATDARGIQTDYSYDHRGRMLTMDTRLVFGLTTESAQESWLYSHLNGVVTAAHTGFRGNLVTSVTDPLGRVTSISDAARGATATKTYDGVNLTSETDFLGHNTSYAYDSLNRQTSSTNEGGQLLVSYSDSTRQVTTTDRRGIVTVSTSDQAGNLLTTIREGITTVTKSYDLQNRLVEAIDASAVVLSMSYDLLGRLLTDGTGDQITTYGDYNDLGNPRSISDGLEVRTLTYDYYGRVLTEKNGLDDITSTTYDPAGNPLSATKPSATGLGVSVMTFGYDLFNNLTGVTNADGTYTDYLWINNWTHLTVTDALNEQSTWSYDLSGRLTEIQQPGLGTTAYDYDANDNRIEITRPQSQVTLSYDYANRLLNESWDGNADFTASIDTITRVRDANGNTTSVSQTGSEGTYTREITYDNFDRPTDFGDSRGFAINLGYKDNGNRAFVRDHRGLEVSYTYDSANRLETAQVGSLGTATYAYYANGLPQSLSLPNSVTGNWTYDGATRLTSLTWNRPDTTETRYEATYNGDGSRATFQETRTGFGTWETSYTYDINARLTDWTRSTPQATRTTSYSLDDVGNRTRETETGTDYDRTRDYSLLAGHRIAGFSETITAGGSLTDDRGVVYDYDLNGNRTSKTDTNNLTSTVDLTTMVWDARDRMRTVNQPDGGSLAFDYDDLDRRIRKQGDGRNGAAILYVWDQLAVLEEYSEVTSGLPTFLAGYSSGRERLLMDRVGDGPSWMQHDPMSSVADLTDTLGSLIEAKTYTPFGKEELIYSAPEGGWNRYGFTGHEYDPETKLTYAKARFNDQDLGLFTSMDRYDYVAFDKPPSLHRYLYANANPLLYWDPDGNTVGEFLWGATKQVGSSLVNMTPVGQAWQSAKEGYQQGKEMLNRMSDSMDATEGSLGEKLLAGGSTVIRHEVEVAKAKREKAYKTIVETLTTKEGAKKAWVTVKEQNPVYKTLVAQYEARQVIEEMRNTDPKDWTERMGADLAEKSIDTATGLVETATLAYSVAKVVGGGLKASVFKESPKKPGGQLTGKMCFVAGTQVVTENGLKNIEDIEVGDVVLTKGDKGGSITYQPVVATFVTNPDVLFHVIFQAEGDEEEELITTSEHPFYVVSKGEWIRAEDLEPGDDLYLANGNLAEMVRVEIERGPPTEAFTTYNFTVADTHTYFVLSDGGKDREVAVWVHNFGKKCPPTVEYKENLARSLRRGYPESEIGPSGLPLKHNVRISTLKELKQGGYGTARKKGHPRRKHVPRRVKGKTDPHKIPTDPSKKAGAHNHTGPDNSVRTAKPKVYRVWRRGGPPSMNKKNRNKRSKREDPDSEE